MAGRMVKFSTNGGTTDGYLATPASGKGPGVIVIQEWWGLVPHIKEVCDRFAANGFVGLAKEILYVASPGAADPDVTRLPYTKRKTPFWPKVADPWGPQS